MPYWLLQSLSGNPQLAVGQPLEGILAPEEQQELARFRSAHRRSDWLLGRWTAKRLLQQIVSSRCAFEPPLASIIISAEGNGAPVTAFRAPDSGQAFALSISHSHGYALCAVTEGEDAVIGVDLESIEPRDDQFVTALFNEDERRLVPDRPDRVRHMHVTAIWSAKEAALKATRTGLRSAPQQVSCLIQPVYSAPQDWLPFRIKWQAQSPQRDNFPNLTGWWQVLGDFVLTLATTAG